MTLLSDSRGQSVVLGSMLVFALAVLGLGLYQVTVVPQQNAEVELSHAETVDDDFVNVHTGIMNAAQSGEDVTVSVKLGTGYPARALTLNPPSATGAIRTETFPEADLSGQITSATSGEVFSWYSELCGLKGDHETRALVYSPNYNRIRNIGVHAYENSVTYQDDDETLADYNQDLVDEGEITLRPLVAGDLSTTSISREPVTFEPGVTGGTAVEAQSDWTLTIPTRLSAEQWETVLADEMAPEGRVDSVSEGSDSGTVDITFVGDDDESYTVSCTPLGVEESPDNNPKVVPGSPGNDPGTINPRGPNELELRETFTRGGSGSLGNELVARFFNKHNADKVVVRARVPYVINPGGSGDDVELEPQSPPGGVTSVDVSGGFKDVHSQPDWTWQANSNQEVAIGGDAIKAGPNTGVAVVFKFADGSTSTYFIHPSS